MPSHVTLHGVLIESRNDIEAAQSIACQRQHQWTNMAHIFFKEGPALDTAI
jgi:hypothetical protein